MFEIKTEHNYFLSNVTCVHEEFDEFIDKQTWADNRSVKAVKPDASANNTAAI